MIFIYGAPGSGKTTFAEALAKALKRPCIDLDHEVEKKAKMSIAEIFEKQGEAAFREYEKRCLNIVVKRRWKGTIVALGGGTLLDDENLHLVGKDNVFCLDTPPKRELMRRLKADGKKRPLGDMSKERKAHYASFPQRIQGYCYADQTLVVVGKGIAGLSVRGPRSVVTLRDFGGEACKQASALCEVWSRFAKDGVRRDSLVTAIGGGTTCDLVGFAAATWMRGVDWICVPTTLLAMVDAGIGGKTAINLNEGKNLVGAFHEPRLTVIDKEFLESLPKKERRNGRAEMIKHEIISGKRKLSLFDSIKVKAAIVTADPVETKGSRILLNCGHTIAHALEKLLKYEIPHGEAVSIGLVEEAKIAVEEGLAAKSWPKELAKVLSAEGLPVKLPKGITRAKLLEAARNDKKNHHGFAVFALPCGWGNVKVWYF